MVIGAGATPEQSEAAIAAGANPADFPQATQPPQPPPRQARSFEEQMSRMMAQFQAGLARQQEASAAQLAQLQAQGKADIARLRAEVEANRKRRETELAFKAKKGKKTPGLGEGDKGIRGDTNIGDFVLGSTPGGKTLLGV